MKDLAPANHTLLSMRVKLISFTLMLLFLTAAKVSDVYGSQAMDFLVYRHSITITVKCMDEALVEMGNMPGFELSSNISVVQGLGQATRKVLNHDTGTTLDLLRQLGEVTHSASEASNVFTRWASLRAEIHVRTREYDRLMELLHNATTMAQFNQIETRLREVISQLEIIQGQLNALEFERGTSQIFIGLNVYVPADEYEEEPEPEPEPEYEEESETIGRLAQIGNAFTTSAGGTFVAVQAILILLAYISLPLIAIIAIVAACVKWLPKRRPKARVEETAPKEAVVPDDSEQLVNEDSHVEEVETDEEN